MLKNKKAGDDRFFSLEAVFLGDSFFSLGAVLVVGLGRGLLRYFCLDTKVTKTSSPTRFLRLEAKGEWRYCFFEGDDALPKA